MSDDDRTRVARRRRRARIFSAFLVVAVSIAWFFRNPLFRGNFGIVEDGRVYRSAQPGQNLRQLAADHRVSSILNLGGGNEHEWCYANEVEVTRELGVSFYDFPMSATRRPSRRELLILLDLFERCRYPLLIHCRQGADRTALASALYLLACSDRPPDEAVGEFSLYFGHFGDFPVSGTRHLQEPFAEYERWLESHRLHHTRERFRSWVETDYQSKDPVAPYPKLQAGPRASLQAWADH